MEHLDSSRSIQVDMLTKVDFGEASLSQQAYQAIATKLFPYTVCHSVPLLKEADSLTLEPSLSIVENRGEHVKAFLRDVRTWTRFIASCLARTRQRWIDL